MIPATAPLLGTCDSQSDVSGSSIDTPVHTCAPKEVPLGYTRSGN
jgi:hypothetical protein